MKILIIEDGSEKIKDLQVTLKDKNHIFQIVETEKEAKEKLQKNKFDMILLDMELPCSNRNALNMNKFSGITIMNSMKCYNIETPVLLITQYVNFVDMETKSEETEQNLFTNIKKENNIKNCNMNLYGIKFLEQLHDFMSDRYPNYIGAIHYSNISNKWKSDLMYFIDKIGGNNNEGTGA